MSTFNRFIIFVLVLILINADFDIVPDAKANLNHENIEALAIAGTTYILDLPPDDSILPSTQCECDKNTGRISYDGGTSFTQCPCVTSPDSKCGCVNCNRTQTSLTSTETATHPLLSSGRFSRTIVITQPRTCPPCRLFDLNTLDKFRSEPYKKAGWTVGKESKNIIQVLDLDDPESFNLAGTIPVDVWNRTIPCIIEVKKDKTFGRKFQTLTVDQLVQLSYGKL